MPPDLYSSLSSHSLSIAILPFIPWPSFFDDLDFIYESQQVIPAFWGQAIFPQWQIYILLGGIKLCFAFISYFLYQFISWQYSILILYPGYWKNSPLMRMDVQVFLWHTYIYSFCLQSSFLRWIIMWICFNFFEEFPC